MTSLMTQQTQTPDPPPLMEISTQRAISLMRRWQWMSVLINVGIAAAFIGGMYAYERGGFLVVVAMFVLWTFISSWSARTRRMAFDAGQYIAAGEYSLAEDRLSQSMESFSLARSTKQLGLQQLAMLRHAQARWADAAALARAFLATSSRRNRTGDVPSRLVLAESLLELNDLDGVSRELHGLAVHRLNLRETMLQTQIRLDLQARRGEFAAMMQQPLATVQLIELMPAGVSMRGHALLALAAFRTGRIEWHAWLSRRAMLLGDVEALIESRPFLSDAFPVPLITKSDSSGPEQAGESI